MARYKLLFFIIIFTSILSCKKNSVHESTIALDSLNSIQKKDKNISNLDVITGTYNGVISCDDCENVQLTLKNNGEYSLLIHLADEEDSRKNTTLLNGRYIWNSKDSIISLDQNHFKFLKQKNKLYFLFDNSLNIAEDEVLVKE
ncbi:hypothetical protein ETU08_09870 [Apibacter muscae]|uniref:Copper resistance protein NlpE n=1 Tax=Apibacter muscae TaxID=2509004 RepID=A0A563D8A9_9FLAO|nr:copper resistance protein NlpE N-terminal domain-containing protein [Apibacter muscae]TWP22946.1 hypothetical protein ETU10_10170 [Apibacter muscae]TWP26171.1 hypothetical protein ETU09_10750 [Apibacter muscae]TWP28015.1 hypothetical protein ETU08_09870 [Apibacter muscae]